MTQAIKKVKKRTLFFVGTALAFVVTLFFGSRFSGTLSQNNSLLADLLPTAHADIIATCDSCGDGCQDSSSCDSGGGGDCSSSCSDAM